MSKLNITGLQPIVDPFYRYKMSRLDVVDQRNSVAIRNIQIVAADLGVSPVILVKHFKRSFSCSFVYKRGILSTAKEISYEEFTASLNVFIESFVLCPVCRLPEIDYTYEGGSLYLKCRSCPNTSKVASKNKQIMDTATDIITLLKKPTFVSCGTCHPKS